MLKVLATLRAAYPNFYKNLSAEEFGAVVKLWEFQFRDCEYPETVAACHSLIATRTSTYPPTIGELKKALHEVREPGAVTAEQAWDMVRDAIGRGSVHSREDWERFPGVVQKAISPDEIRRLAIMEDGNEGVMKAQFLKAFAIVQEREREAAVMPVDISRMIESRLKEKRDALTAQGHQEGCGKPPDGRWKPPDGFTPVNIRERLLNGGKGA